MIGKANKDGKFLKRLLIVLGVIAGCILLLVLVAYTTRPQVRYTLQTADCSQTAIDKRNRAEKVDLKACILIINATNLKNTSELIDWEGVGGGPLASWHPMIKINGPNGKFCYAGVVDLTILDALGPYESRDLALRCSGSSGKMPEQYDEHSDENPISIVINDWHDTTLVLKPIR